MNNVNQLHIGLLQLIEAFNLKVSRKINLLEFDLQLHQPAQFLTQTQLSQLFNVDIKTIRNWSRKGKLKFYKYGTRVFYKRHELITVITH